MHPTPEFHLVALNIPVLFGTETGNAEFCSEDLVTALQDEGFNAELIDMMDFNPSDIISHQVAIIVTSTYGNGDPPSNAEAMLNYLQKTAPALDHLHFAVCGLGDSSFTHFAQCGKDFEKALLACSAKPMFARVDCDEDYEVAFERFKNIAVEYIVANQDEISASSATQAPLNEAPTSPVSESAETLISRDKPFTAQLSAKRLLSKEGSAKETMHYEVDLGDSGIAYRVGDCFGVHPINASSACQEVLDAAALNESASVSWRGEEITLGAALKRACLQQVTLDLIKTLAALPGGASGAAAKALDQGDAAVTAFIRERHVVDALRSQDTSTLSAQALVGALRRLQPRLYSVASSPTHDPKRVGFTIETLRYNWNERAVQGVASCWLADQVAQGEGVPLYLVKNDSFLFPADESPVIMIGPGTGIAPFRGYLQEVEAAGITNQTWLFFGHQHASKDFLYEGEIKRWMMQGTLNKASFAWSRDQAEKVYVQDRILEQGAEVWSWMERGAIVYVCGDAKGMAPAVEEAFKSLAETHGGQSDGGAWLETLVKDERYKTDVY